MIFMDLKVSVRESILKVPDLSAHTKLFFYLLMYKRVFMCIFKGMEM